MKFSKISTILLLLFSGVSLSAQDIFDMPTVVVTEGKDSQKGTYAYLERVAIIEIPDKNQTELYESTINWLNETYINPDEVIKGKVENEYIRWTGTGGCLALFDGLLGAVCYEMRYTIEVRFKEGRLRWEFIELEIYTPPSQYIKGGWSSWDGRFRVANYKGKYNKDISNGASKYRSYMNDTAKNYKEYLLKGNTADDDW